MEVTAVASVVVAALSAGAAYLRVSEGDPYHTASAYEIASGLNGLDHMAEHVTVEEGFDLPIGPDVADGAHAIYNPIRIRPNVYAFVDHIDQSGLVSLHAFAYDGELIPDTTHSREHAHEIITSLAEVYTTVTQPDGHHENQYMVVMGDLPGPVESILQIPPTLDPSEQATVRSQQLSEIAESIVGNPFNP
ncbi:MAG TPA: hypothetical protein VJP80_01730 [Candidatus Saccharimonadales bacterium]|nr:hypothetical protein [Candidatus Saccharimonadales bacterium]